MAMSSDVSLVDQEQKRLYLVSLVLQECTAIAESLIEQSAELKDVQQQLLLREIHLLQEINQVKTDIQRSFASTVVPSVSPDGAASNDVSREKRKLSDANLDFDHDLFGSGSITAKKERRVLSEHLPSTDIIEKQTKVKKEKALTIIV